MYKVYSSRLNCDLKDKERQAFWHIKNNKHTLVQSLLMPPIILAWAMISEVSVVAKTVEY